MKVNEEFEIAQPPQTLWEFFDQLDRVAQCVPGVEKVTVVDADNSQVRITQALGPMTATFDVKMRVTARDPGKSMEFTAVGRSVKGAAGNVRATHVVRLQESGEGSTRVRLEGDVALGGMLGSVGQKVVAKQAAVVTQSFAQALAKELGGESSPEGESEPEPASPGSTGADSAGTASVATGSGGSGAAVSDAQAGAPTPSGGGRFANPAPLALAGVVFLLLVALVRRRRRAR